MASIAVYRTVMFRLLSWWFRCEASNRAPRPPAGPARSAVEFVLRREERLPGDEIDINSGLMIVPVGILKRSFGGAFPRYAILVFG